MAIFPMQPQPVKAAGDNVGYIEGAKDVGDADADAVGAAVGAAVGLDGQLVMPCLKTHKAFASTRCCSMGKKQGPTGVVLS